MQSYPIERQPATPPLIGADAVKTISRLELLEQLRPYCEPDAVSLMYPQGETLGIGWVYGQAEVDRAIEKWRNGLLGLQLFATKNQEGRVYAIRQATRLGLVAHRNGKVLWFCIDLDDHDGGKCNVALVDKMDEFLGAKAIRFTSKSGRGFHLFYALSQPMPVAEFIAWVKAWGFNGENQPECFPKTHKKSQFWLPNEPNGKGGDVYMSGDFATCIVKELPIPPAASPATPPSPRRLKPFAGPEATLASRARKYVARMDPSIQGSGGSAKAMAVARVLCWGYALDEEISYDIFLNDFNPRCKPPWSELEIRHKLADGAKPSSVRPYGWLRDAARPAERKEPSQW